MEQTNASRTITEPPIALSGLNVGLDADRELIADAMAFRALATMPSLWQLTLMFGAPHFQMNIAWGTGAGIEVRQYDIQENRVLALRKLISKTQAEVMVSNVKVSGSPTDERTTEK